MMHLPHTILSNLVRRQRSSVINVIVTIFFLFFSRKSTRRDALDAGPLFRAELFANQLDTCAWAFLSSPP